MDHAPDRRALPGPTVCLDPFHIIKLSTDALDEVRREVWNQGRRARQTALARELKGARVALWKNPERLTPGQKLKLARVKQINEPLYRGYLLCQQLRPLYRVPHQQAIAPLHGWLAWAQRCRLEPFVKLARTIRAERPESRQRFATTSRTPGPSRSTRRSACATNAEGGVDVEDRASGCGAA